MEDRPRLRFLRPDESGCYERHKAALAPPAPRRVSLVLMPPPQTQRSHSEGKLIRWRSVPFAEVEDTDDISVRSLKMFVRRQSNMDRSDVDRPGVVLATRRNTTVGVVGDRGRKAVAHPDITERRWTAGGLGKKLAALTQPKPRPFPRLIFDPCSDSSDNDELETDDRTRNLFDSISRTQCSDLGAATAPHSPQTPLFPVHPSPYNAPRLGVGLTTAATTTPVTPPLSSPSAPVSPNPFDMPRPASPVAALVGKWESMSSAPQPSRRTDAKQPSRRTDTKQPSKKGLSALVSAFKAMTAPRRESTAIFRPKAMQPDRRQVAAPPPEEAGVGVAHAEPRSAPVDRSMPAENEVVYAAELDEPQAPAAAPVEGAVYAAPRREGGVQLPPSPPIEVRVREDDVEVDAAAIEPAPAVDLEETQPVSIASSSAAPRSPSSSGAINMPNTLLVPPAPVDLMNSSDQENMNAVDEEKEELKVVHEDRKVEGLAEGMVEGMVESEADDEAEVESVDRERAMVQAPSSSICVSESADDRSTVIEHNMSATSSFLASEDLSVSQTVTSTTVYDEDPPTSVSSLPSSMDLEELGPFRPASGKLEELNVQSSEDEQASSEDDIASRVDDKPSAANFDFEPHEEEKVATEVEDDDIASRVVEDEPKPVVANTHVSSPSGAYDGDAVLSYVPKPLPEFLQRSHEPDEAPPPSPCNSTGNSEPLNEPDGVFAPPVAPVLPAPLPAGSATVRAAVPYSEASLVDARSPAVSPRNSVELSQMAKANARPIATPKLSRRHGTSSDDFDVPTAYMHVDGQASPSLPAIYSSASPSTDDAMSALSSEDEGSARALVIQDAAQRLARAYKLLDNRGVRRAHLCTHIDLRYTSLAASGWECGHLTAAALISSLLHDEAAGAALRAAGLHGPPDSDDIARRIEAAWAAGFDTSGAQRYGGKLVGRRAYLGATEVAVLLVAAGVEARVRKFETPAPRDRRQFFEWLDAYFADAYQRGAACALHERRRRSTLAPAVMHPLFVQWAGRALLVVGTEKTRRGDIRALVLEPTASFADALEARGVKSRVAAARRGENHPMWRDAQEFHVVFVEHPDDKVSVGMPKNAPPPPRRVARLMRKSRSPKSPSLPSPSLARRWRRRNERPVE